MKLLKLLPFFTIIIMVSTCDKEQLEPEDTEPLADFCYKISARYEKYDSLDHQDSLEHLTLDQHNLMIADFGFDFKYCNKTFNKFYMSYDEPLGAFQYTYENDKIDMSPYSIKFFEHMNLGTWWETAIYKHTSGTAGNRICKIAYNDLFYKDWFGTTEGYVTVQLWFYEKDGKIEIHYGPNSVGPDKMLGEQQNTGPRVTFRGALPENVIRPEGDIENPTTSSENGAYLSDVPKEGQVLVFSY